MMNCKTSQGHARPYGVTQKDNGTNFAIFAKALRVTLCLFESQNGAPSLEIPLDPILNKTGDVWHILIHDLPQNILYAYRVNHQSVHQKQSPYLLDPYAKALGGSILWGQEWQKNMYHPLGVIDDCPEFNWEEVQPPKIPMQDLIIYEMHIRGFTQHDSSNVKEKGKYLGVIEKIPYLKNLGINAVELLPLYEFNEQEVKQHNPLTKQKLFNFWGYSSANFFSPMRRYASSPHPHSALLEFKTLVKELHRNGIEVILDVVYNHTLEGNAKGLTLSFRGFDPHTYYIIDPEGHYLNYSGCGNTLNCNHPVVMELIIESLRYWVTEMHVDGFRFDLASILTRNREGTPSASAPLIEAISLDPILAQVKLIAEPWDAVGLYQVGSFFPQVPRWAEWNGKYRDTLRRFIRGISGQKGEFATRICGSQDLYGFHRAPYHSINFITCHDGYSLADLVSYQKKHNLENGEENRDGTNDNESWNCGVEGPTKNLKIQALRQRQMRNFHLALMISQGVPMLLMGDEYGHTRKGNNNPWCQDNEMNWFLWDKIHPEDGFQRFYRLLIHFRKEHPILKRSNFLSSEDIEWHGCKPLMPEWNKENRFLAFTLKERDTHNDLYVAFNCYEQSEMIRFPKPPEKMDWHWIVNTYNPSPNDFIEPSLTKPISSKDYNIPPFCAILLKAQPI